MKRGTRVGQAYVEGTFDGSGMNQEIVDSVDEAGPGVERAGEDHGERYGNRFGEGFGSRMDAIREKIGKHLGDRLEDEGGKAGTKSSGQFSKNFDEAMNDGLLSRIGDRLGTHIGGHMVDAMNKALTEDGFEGNTLRELFKKIDAARVSGNAGGGIGGGGGDRGIGDRIGDLFGAGSRNNFLNLFGKSLGGIINLTEKARVGASRLGSVFMEGFKQAGEGANFFQKALAGVTQVGGFAAQGGAKFLTSLAAGGPAAAAAILVLVVALSAMVSVVGALIALVTALSATIVSGLTAALVVAGGAMGALVVAGGLLTAAFMSMTDAQKTLLKDAFRPLREEMIGIGQIMLQEMVPAFGTWSSNLQKALLLVAPLAEKVGYAFAQAGNNLTAAFSGPGFQALSNSLGVYLPGIIMALSTAFGQWLNGVAALLAAVMPYVQQFATYLAGVATDFSAWANSVDGQNTISDWVFRALESLKSLWNFIGEFTGFVTDVLFSPEAQSAGNSIFDSLADAFAGFRDKVAEASANGDLQKWFDDAIQFGSALWSVIQALGGVFMDLYNSGVLDTVSIALRGLADAINIVMVFLKPMVDTLGFVLPPILYGATAPIRAVAGAFEWVGGVISSVTNRIRGEANAAAAEANRMVSITSVLGSLANMGNKAAMVANQAKFTVPKLQMSGASALGGTNIPKPKKGYKNPYADYARSLIKSGPSMAAQIKAAVLSVQKEVNTAITEATRAVGSADAYAGIMAQVTKMREDGLSIINDAQQNLNSAAQTLASATSKKAAQAALKQVKQAQKDLKAAQLAQRRIKAASDILAKQRITTPANVDQLMQGLRVQNATLADYAAARERVADLLEKANDKLSDAISLRDNFRTSVTDAVKAFGELTTATAQTINGVEQALTANDITSNLQSRLAKIQKFQSDLRLLLAQGLSNDAYKQIVDQGVDAGSAFAEALLGGGGGSISEVNDLVGQVNGIADDLGLEASSRMYQAGVDAAQGLVDGLTSLSAQLDAAATALGNSIAAAIKRALGIASPSKVLYNMMDAVGDGAVGGLDNQHIKVGAAASRFADQIAVSPEVANYAAGQGQPATVSGNDPRFRDLIVQTPTENPEAVAMEVLNEVVGRLP